MHIPALQEKNAYLSPEFNKQRNKHFNKLHKAA